MGESQQKYRERKGENYFLLLLFARRSRSNIYLGMFHGAVFEEGLFRGHGDKDCL